MKPWRRLKKGSKELRCKEKLKTLKEKLSMLKQTKKLQIQNQRLNRKIYKDKQIKLQVIWKPKKLRRKFWTRKTTSQWHHCKFDESDPHKLFKKLSAHNYVMVSDRKYLN